MVRQVIPALSRRNSSSRTVIQNPFGYIGAPARTRTVNQLIKSQLLYQLSYRGTN
jgi:hypothetical protein